MSRLAATRVALAALLAAMAPALVNAATYDKLAYLTFTGPVQVPGVTLHAGTYGFRLANPDTSRNVLQVVSSDGAIVYATFHTVPDSRTLTTPDPVVSFRETPAGVPAAVRSLFYGGEHNGYEFVYPKGGFGPVAVARSDRQPGVTRNVPPSPPAVLDGSEAVITLEPLEYLQAPAPAAEPPPATELPRTGSPLPFAAAGGLASLLAGLALGIVRRRRG
jgi:LPXTG-motif cell wall-anchored protein